MSETVKALFVLDAYSGLFQLNFLNEDLSRPVSIENIFNSKTIINLPDSSSPADSKSTLEMKFFNDLDVSSDGTVFFTDSSYMYYRSQNRQEVLDGAPRGRLFQYDLSHRHLKVLMCGLHFPNGVQIQAGHSSVLVVESTRFRILRVNTNILEKSNDLVQSCDETGSLYGVLTSQRSNPSVNKSIVAVSVFLDQGPGFMDNIRIVKPMRRTDKVPSPNYFVGIGKYSFKCHQAHSTS